MDPQSYIKESVQHINQIYLLYKCFASPTCGESNLFPEEPFPAISIFRIPPHAESSYLVR